MGECIGKRIELLDESMRQNWLEWLFVCGAGFSLSIIMNYHSRNGLDISRDYFAASVGNRPSSSPPSRQGEDTVEPGAFETELAQALERLKQTGLQPISAGELVALVGSPDWESGRVMLVDARNEILFHESHIPGAYLFDHYQMERHVDEVLPMCQIADQVIVYCSGGHCEDSELAANDLLQFGVSPSKVFIFAAGMRGLIDGEYPLATGDREDDFEEYRDLISSGQRVRTEVKP